MIIEAEVIKYLKDVLKIPVFTEEKNLDQYILITRISSKRENYIDSAILSIKSYDTTKLKASQLNEKVKHAMDKIIDLPSFSSSKLNSDYESTDTIKKKYRYTALYELVYY